MSRTTADFPWLVANTRGSSAGADRRSEVILAELRDRAATLYRLGYSPQAAADRLEAELCWEFEPESKRDGAHRRPAACDKAAIEKLVKDVFDRRPS